LPLGRETITVLYKDGQGLSSETRQMWRTSLGPVVERANGKIYVLRARTTASIAPASSSFA
jgi:hypothetical protein